MNINGFYSAIIIGVLLLTSGCSKNGDDKQPVSGLQTQPPGPQPESKTSPQKRFEYDRQRGCFAEAIVNGSIAAATNPLKNHVVMLMSRVQQETENGPKEVTSLCTGTLIGPKTVLSAAHCFPKGTVSTQVIASINLYCSSGFNQRLVYNARKVKIHPKYRFKIDPTGTDPDYDVAVVTFDGILPSEYEPIPVQKLDVRAEMQNTSGSHLIMIGYGRTSTNDTALPELRFLEKNWDRLILHRDSVSLVDQQGLVSVNQADSRGGCSGDSGGPLLINDNGALKILGVASYIEAPPPRDRLCEQGQLYYSYITTFADWIAEQM